MKKILSLFIAIILIGNLNAQDKPQYAVFLIPDSLMKGVNSVLREDIDRLVINKPGKGKQTVRKVITVLNENGARWLGFADYFDRFRNIDDVEINIYDAFGKYIKRSRKKDLKQEANGQEGSLVIDSKIMYAEFRVDKYPATIEIQYEINFEGMLEYEDFYPQADYQSIQSRIYSIVTDASNKVRYKNYRCAVEPKVKTEGNLITYTWEVKNVTGFKREAGSARTDVPHVLISPTLFNMDDYLGDMSSWQTFGKWQTALISQTNKLPEERANYYRDLVKNAKSDREKIELLYNHLQQNYRYVSIQLGIGGWKPFPADFVEKKKYGDCKALSNFMQAMLNSVNIKSHYAIINAGTNELPADASFPHRFSNHIILCVPQGKDTIWLECTSRTQPFGKLGPFTENRNAFLITETGGQIVPTPRSQPEDNVITTYSEVTITEDGSGSGKFNISHTGEFTDIIFHNLVDGKEEDKKEFLYHTADFKQGDDLKIVANSSNRYEVVKLEMNYEKVPDFSAGSKLFLSPRMYKFWDQALPKIEKRNTDYYLGFPQVQVDTTIYKLPEGYVVETLPKPARIEYPLGIYEANYRFDADKKELITTCRIKLKQHTIPPSLYQDAAQFFSDVIKEQQQKVVVKKND